MDVDESDSTFSVQNSKGTENNAELSGISTKRVELSLGKKCKRTKKKHSRK